MGIFASKQSGLRSRRIIAWIAANVLVLQSVFAPMPAVLAKEQGAGLDTSVSELCIHNNKAAGPADGGIPAGTYDADVRCKSCVGCGSGVVIPPKLPMAWIKQARSVLVNWAVLDNPVPDGAWLIGKRARGPPLLA